MKEEGCISTLMRPKNKQINTEREERRICHVKRKKRKRKKESFLN
jgi:hypothetical protein